MPYVLSQQELSEDNEIRQEATKIKITTFSECLPIGNQIKIATFSECHSMFKSRSLCKKLWYCVKGIVTRNTHVKYGSTISRRSQVMTKVKVF